MSDQSTWEYPDEETADLARRVALRIGTRVIDRMLHGDATFNGTEWVCAAIRLLGMVGVNAPQEGHPLAGSLHDANVAVMRVAVRMVIHNDDGTRKDLAHDRQILAALAGEN